MWLTALEPSFSVVINKLREENARLFEEVRELRSRESVESGRRQRIEELGGLQSNQQRLEDQVQNYADAADYFKGVIARCFFGLDKVLPVLHFESNLHNCLPAWTIPRYGLNHLFTDLDLIPALFEK